MKTKNNPPHALFYLLFMTGVLLWMSQSEDSWEGARPLSPLPLTLQGTERPLHVCISLHNQIEKPSPDKWALWRAEGRFNVSLSLSDGDVEGRLWRSACSPPLQSLVQCRGPSTWQYPHYPSFSASTDVHQALCLDIQHTLSVCYGPTQVTVQIQIMEELFWSVWQLNTLMCGVPRQPAKLSSAPVPVPSNSTMHLPLSVVILFIRRGYVWWDRNISF